MPVEVKTNRSAWKRAVEGGSEKAVEALANQMMNDCRRFIPNDGEHTLKDIGRIENGNPGERFLVWNNVYAAYQWYGVRADGSHVVKKYTTPGTGKQWVEKAKNRFYQTWKKVVQNAFNGGF